MNNLREFVEKWRNDACETPVDDESNVFWRYSLIRQMYEHITKGDPRDVAAYCLSHGHRAWVERQGEWWVVGIAGATK